MKIHCVALIIHAPPPPIPQNTSETGMAMSTNPILLPVKAKDELSNHIYKWYEVLEFNMNLMQCPQCYPLEQKVVDIVETPGQCGGRDSIPGFYNSRNC